MINSNVIEKKYFRDFLEKTFINKDDVTLLMYFFKMINDIDLHEKVMFLLYNEYITVDQLFSCMSNYTINGENVVIESENGFKNDFKSKLNILINSVDVEFTDDKNLYKYMKNYFIRDYITTLTYEHYKDSDNYMAQMDVVYNSLSDIERSFLSDYLGITNNNFINLVRMQITDDKIILSDLETYHDPKIPSNQFATYIDKNDSSVVKDKNEVEYTKLTEFPVSTTYNDKYFLVKTSGVYNNAYYWKNCVVYQDNPGNDKIGKLTRLGYINLPGISELLNLTDSTKQDYWYIETVDEYDNRVESESYSVRDLLLSVLNKISLGTIH